MRWLCTIVLALLLAAPGWAQTSPDVLTNCAGSAVDATHRTVGSSGALCLEFDSGIGTGGTAGFRVQPGNAATLCLDPDRNSSGTTGAAVVSVEVCPLDPPGDNGCIATGLVLSGTNPCEAVISGRYRFNVTTAPTGTQDAVVAVRGY